MLFTLCSCSGVFTSPLSLLTPPKSSGELAQIEEYLNTTVGDYTLCYPQTEDFGNAINFCDLDGDKSDEAIVFYETTQGETVSVHMNVLAKFEKGYQSVDEQIISGIGIDRVGFWDVCLDDTLEIFVGSKIYNTNRQNLTVFSYENATLKSRYNSRYTDYFVTDLGAGEKPQILVLDIVNSVISSSEDLLGAPITTTCTASLVTLSSDSAPDGEAHVCGSARFDSNVISFSKIARSTTADNAPCVFVDAIVGENEMITEIFTYQNKKLKTTFYSKATKTTVASRRESLISSNDVDGDGKIEIPKTYLCHGYENEALSANKVYFTEWYEPQGNALTKHKASGFLNSADNYFVGVPKLLLGKITAKKIMDERERVFYSWNFGTNDFGDELFRIKVFYKNNFDKDSEGFSQIATDDNYVYAVKVSKNDDIDLEYIKQNFRLL